MADKKITELPAASLPIATGVKFEAVQGGINVQVDADDMPGSGAAVASVTGENNAVDNTDTANPIVRNGRRIVTSASDPSDLVTKLSDNNGVIICDDTTPFSLTLEQLAQWTSITILNIGSAAVTLLPGSGVTITGSTTLPGAVGTFYPTESILYHSLTTPRVLIGSQAEPIEATPDTSGSTIQIDCNGAIQVIAVGSASFATSKLIELINHSNAKVINMKFNLTNVAAALTFITEDFRAQSADSRFNNTSQVFTPAGTGRHEMSVVYDHVDDIWDLIITTPYG